MKDFPWALFAVGGVAIMVLPILLAAASMSIQQAHF